MDSSTLAPAAPTPKIFCSFWVKIGPLSSTKSIFEMSFKNTANKFAVLDREDVISNFLSTKEM